MANINEKIENVKGKVTQASGIAIQKAKDMGIIAKSKVAIKTEEDKIKKAQLELGKLYYKDYIAGETPDAAEYTPWCEKINESKLAIEDLKATIDELKKKPEVEEAPAKDDEIVVEITEDDLVTPEETPGETGGEPSDEPAAE